MEKDNLRLFTQLKKLQNAYTLALSELSTRENLTQIELSILGFLKINPTLDTARDIEGANLIKKSNISNAIEHLIEEGLLIRSQDLKDRRIMHLEITEKAQSITKEILVIQKKFFENLFDGISKEELQTYFTIHKKIIENIEKL